MDKRDKMNSDYAKVVNRLGKTTGVSKGAPAKQGWKVKPKASMSGGGKVSLTFTKKTGKSK